MSDVAPTLPAARGSLHLGVRRWPESSLLSLVQTCLSRFGAASSSLEGVAVSAARKSRFRGPCLKGEKP